MSTPIDSTDLSEPTDFKCGEIPDSEDSFPHEAFPLTECLYQDSAPQAKRYAMSIVRSWNDAEEIVQESFYRFMKSGEQNEQSKAMLFAIVRNLSLDHLRKNKRRRFEPIETNQIPSREHTLSDQHLENLEAGIQVAMGELPKEWADALQLKVNGGLSYADISKILEATHAQIRTWIYRARKQLEQELTRQGLLGEVDFRGAE
jgi:RNA polymerase sigma-70 factor (ECF subfamily)